MADEIAFLNTVFGTRFDAGAEKVIRLFRAELEQRGRSTSIISIACGEAADAGAMLPRQHYEIRNPSAYFTFPAREHPVIAKTAFHMLENFNPLAVSRVRRSGALDRADVLFTHNVRGFSAGVWAIDNRARDLVRVHYIHDYQLICTASAMMTRDRICQTPCARCRTFTVGRKFMSGRVDVVYGASQYVLDRHIELGFFDGAIARVIEPPLALGEGAIRTHMPTRIRRFGFFGRIVTEKGLHILLDAFERFRSALPADMQSEVSLFVAGGGEGAYFDAMLERIGDVEGASYGGVMPPERYFDQIDALVVPSIWPEPSGLVVVEAYQFGKPVIGARVGGLQSGVREGATGLHFHHDDGGASLIAALGQAVDGIDLSASAMRDMVESRDIVRAVDTLLGDIEQVRRSRGAART